MLPLYVGGLFVKPVWFCRFYPFVLVWMYYI